VKVRPIDQSDAVIGIGVGDWWRRIGIVGVNEPKFKRGYTAVVVAKECL
jgi:hypothetical protein